MSPRSIGSHRYTNLLTKIRSWSSSEGIMLVPSTLTGWYRKMMMKAEIVNEMIRSRSQTASMGTLRTADLLTVELNCGLGLPNSAMVSLFYGKPPPSETAFLGGEWVSRNSALATRLPHGAGTLPRRKYYLLATP